MQTTWTNPHCKSQPVSTQFGHGNDRPRTDLARAADVVRSASCLISFAAGGGGLGRAAKKQTKEKTVAENARDPAFGLWRERQSPCLRVFL